MIMPAIVGIIIIFEYTSIYLKVEISTGYQLPFSSNAVFVNNILIRPGLALICCE